MTARLTGEQMQAILLGAGPDSYSHVDAAMAVGSYTSYVAHRGQWCETWAELNEREREIVVAVLRANQITPPWEVPSDT